MSATGTGRLEAELAWSCGKMFGGSGGNFGGSRGTWFAGGGWLPAASNYKTQQYAKESLSPGKGIAHTIN